MSPTPPADQQVLEDSDLQWEIFWHKNKTKIIGGTIALVAILVVFCVWYLNRNLAETGAQDMLAKAVNAQEWEAVIKRYPGTMPAADATLRLAEAQRVEGKLADSTATFERFLASFPRHPLAGGALFGIAQNLDLEGRTQEAVAAYLRVPTEYPSSYAAPLADYSRAEIFLRDFKTEEARPILENLASANPPTNVSRLAAAQLSRIGSRSSTP